MSSKPTMTSAGSVSASSTSGPTTTGDPTTGASTATNASVGDPSGDAGTDGTTSDARRSCGDGIADPGEACFHKVPLDDLALTDIVLADMNEDGHLDLVGVAKIPIAPRDPGTPYRLITALGDGKGAFTTAFDFVPTHNAGIYPIVEDFDGDGHLDLAVGGVDVDDHVLVYPGDGAGGVGAPVVTTVPFYVHGLEAADLDGDERLDLVVAGGGGIVTLLGDGGGGFTIGDVFAPTGHQDPILADLDGDGELDLVVLDGGFEASLETYFGAGDGTFTPGESLALDFWVNDVELLSPAKGSRPVVLLAVYEPGVGNRLHAVDVDVDGALGAPVLIPEGDGLFLVIGAFDSAPRPDAITFYPAVHAILGEEPWPPAAELLLDEVQSLQGRPGVGDINEDGIDDVAYHSSILSLLLSDP